MQIFKINYVTLQPLVPLSFITNFIKIRQIWQTTDNR